jgi:hypothetical protein
MTNAPICLNTRHVQWARQSALFLLSLVLVSCTPAMNWREVRLAGVSALLPCKPDRAERVVHLANSEVTMQMVGCEVEGAMFALSHAELAPTVEPTALLSEWRAIALAKMNSSAVQERQPQASAGPRFALDLSVTGGPENGDRLHARLAWLVSGRNIYHLAVYGKANADELSENFFQQVRLD